MRHRCIWCKVEKDESDFNVEHVMPQSFGTFEGNFTLVNVVCKACNDFFAKELEPWLARDSLEGFDRFRYGQKEPSEFKSLGKRSTSKIQIPEGHPYAGAWGYTEAGDKQLNVRPFPQIGFAKSPEGPFEWWMLDALPTLDELKAKGYSGNCNIRYCECDSAEATLLLEKVGINATITEKFDPPSGGHWVDQVFRPTVMHRRALAKVSLNYLAHQFGAAVALEPRFDAIRRLVMDGIEPSYPYYGIDEHPIVEGDKQNGRRLFGHALTLHHRPDGVELEGVVSLYNRFRHGFRLAIETGTPIPPRGHFFDIGNRRILELHLS